MQTMSNFCPHCGCEYGKEGSHDNNVAVYPTSGLPLNRNQTKIISTVWLRIKKIINFYFLSVGVMVITVTVFELFDHMRGHPNSIISSWHKNTFLSEQDTITFSNEGYQDELDRISVVMLLTLCTMPIMYGAIGMICIFVPIITIMMICKMIYKYAKKDWNTGLMILWCFLSVIPLFGWILGGINMSKTHHSEGRRKQALVLIIISSVSFVLSIVFTMFIMYLAVVAGN